MKQLETDVAIIGSGCAGMAAGLTAAERGCRVAVFERRPEPGGVIKGGNGVFAVESRMQHGNQLSFSREDAFRFFMEHTHWRVDARLVSDYVNRSADTVDWLEGMGIKFSDVVAYFRGARYTWHFKDHDSPNITDAIWERAQKLGAVVYTETAVKEILKEEGRVIGLMAQDGAGEAVRVQAGAVVVATGGFGGNHEWIKKYTGYEYGVDLFSFSFPDVVGDGIRMAWEAGAARSPMFMDVFVSMPPPYFGPGGTPPELGAFRQPNLMVNLQGERFMNEETMKNPAYAGNAVHRQKNGCAVMIFDEDINRYYEEHDWDLVMPKLPATRSDNVGARVRKAREEEKYEHLFMVDSLEELCAQTGIDPDGLRRTVDEYNKACETGRDPVFHKDARYLRPIKRPKFYAARFYLGGYGGLGGIKINHRTEVLDDERNVIPGLYAAGNDANAIYGDTYPFVLSGNTSAFCYHTGRVAGENVSGYLQTTLLGNV